MTLSPLRSTLSKLTSPLTRGTSGGYDTSIIPYAQQAVQKDIAKQKQFQPLKMVLDLLQRGQYLTANIADEVEESFRTGRPLGESTVQVLKAALQGVTGERKGDWETLLFGGQIEGTSDQAGERPGWLPEEAKGPGMTDPLIHWGGEEATGLAEGIFRPRKLIGLAANIALDPTTYIGFGATSAAKSAAKKYADDVLKLTLATMGPDDFTKVGMKFSEKVGKNVDDVAKVMQKSTIAKRFMEDTYNKAFQTALRNPVTPQTLEDSLLKITSERLTENQGLEPLLQSISRGYRGAGERSLRLGGKEMGASVRQPWAPSRAWDTIKTKFEGTKGGAKLGDAWYAIMNRGPIGEIKRALGIRNPYEQLVHLTQRQISDVGIHTTAEMDTKRYFQAIGEVPEETRKKAMQARWDAETMAKNLGMYDTDKYVPLPNDAIELKSFDVRSKLRNNKKTPFESIEEIDQALAKLSDTEGVKSIGTTATKPFRSEGLASKEKTYWDKELLKIRDVALDEANVIAQKYGFPGIGDYYNARKRGHYLSSDLSGFKSQIDTYKYSSSYPPSPDIPDIFGAVQTKLSQEGELVPVVENLINEKWFRDKWQITDEEAPQILKMWQGIDTVSKDIETKIVELSNKLGIPMDEYFRINHFPNHVGSGGLESGAIKKGGGQEATAAAGHLKKRVLTTEEHIDSAVNMWKSIMGDKLETAWKESGKGGAFDDFVKQWVTDKNLADITLDPLEAYKLLAMDQSKVMARLEMIDQFRQFGIPTADVVKAYPDIERNMTTYGQGALAQYGLFPVDVPGFEGYLFDREVANTLTNVGTLLRGDASTEEFVKAFGWMTQWWKGFVLLTPGYHIRNFISNNVTGFLKFGPRWLDPQKTFGPVATGTMYALHPENYSDLLTGAIKESSGWIETQLNKRIGDFTVKELADYARQSGLISSRTQIAGEIGQKATGILEKVSAKKFAPFKVSQKLGDFVENTAKFQSFIMDYQDMVGKGTGAMGDVAERLATQKQYLEYADQEAKKWFIDYTDLAPFEKNVMAKIIPFYSWLRHNIANQLSGLALYPEMYSVIPKVRGALTSDEDFDYSIMPDYMKNQGYYPVGKTQQGTDVMRWANIPLEDVNKIPIMFEEGNIFRPRMNWRETVDDIMAAAHPVLKSAVELLTGYDVFHKRDIKPFERAAPVFQYLSNAPNVIKFLDGAMRLAGFEDGIKINVSRDGKEVQVNGQVERFLENNVPALRTLDLLLGGTEVVAEGLDQKVEGWVEATFGKKDYFKGLEELFQITSPLGGIKFKEFNEDEQRKTKEAQLYAEAQRLKAREAQDTTAKEIRSAKARKARETRNRRLFR